MADGVEEASILRDHSGRVGQLDANGLNGAMATTSATVKVASQRVRRLRVAGTPNLRSQDGLHPRVAFRTHQAPLAKEKSVEQPWLVGLVSMAVIFVVLVPVICFTRASG